MPREGTVWHFIGQLQTNKTRAVAEGFDWVHTLDRPKLAERLSAQRPTALAPLSVFIQVLIEPEPGKGGIVPGSLRHWPGWLLACRGLGCVA